MGTIFSCSVGKREDKYENEDAHPERKRSRMRLSYKSARLNGRPRSQTTLLELSMWALVETLPHRSVDDLSKLPVDLCQLMLDYLIDSGSLSDEVVIKLAGISFYSLRLGRSSVQVSDKWLSVLVTDRLLALDLSRTGVSPTALQSLPALPALRTANLSHCELQENSIDWIQGCTSLTSLQLSNTNLTAWTLKTLARCTSLRELDVSRCRLLRGLHPLTNLRSLRILNLNCCSRISDLDLPTLATLPELVDLDLSGTGISDAGLGSLAPARSLEVLRLDGTNVSDAEVARLIPHLLELRTLSVARCASVGNGVCRAAASNLPLLLDLDLSRTRTGDVGLRALAPLSNLRSLSLESCGRISDAGLDVLTSLRSLTSLDVGDCPLTSGCVPAIASLPALERLSLAFADVDDAGAAQLARCTTLRALCLDTQTVGDPGIKALGALTRLESLDLFDARVTDAACGALGALRSLTKLEICSGGLTNAGVAKLSGARALVDLSLANNPHVCDGAIPHLLNLRELRTLNLARCGVTTSAVVALGSLETLETLALHGTRVRPTAAAHLVQLNPRLHVKGLEGART